jgi:hypothetical protein
VIPSLIQRLFLRCLRRRERPRVFCLKAYKPEKYREHYQADFNVDSAAIRSFFEKAAESPLGPPALTGDVDASTLETD